ncbi:hypothetical protein [Streptomyces sp. SR-10]|uniref:hypothetical protein n=1 Tax=Streptomyces sp. SR-10 TaxID=3416442 RepID=UPI003CF870F6
MKHFVARIAKSLVKVSEHARKCRRDNKGECRDRREVRFRNEICTIVSGAALRAIFTTIAEHLLSLIG